jgi:2-polyprenyl-6-methoxyphenol hydroxylase-like FAD-dependent oxidoreductase
MDLMHTFHRENVCFLGDAAHPLLAFTSQGANSALEDAVTLASLLGNAGTKENLNDVFSTYYSKRKDFISAYIQQGDAMLQEFLSFGTQGAKTIPLAIH